ncbi:MAG: hypothetical protein ACM3PC_07085 [Deltaproteobacteria bacterium]
MARALAGTLLLAFACAGPNTHMERTVRVVDYTEKEGVLVGTVQTVYPDDTLSCGREMQTGTHISRRICRFQVESNFLRQRTQDMLHALSLGASKAGTELGGSSYRTGTR